MIREMTIGESALLTDLAMCVNHYRLYSPGLYCCVLAPVDLDEQTRYFPGVMSMVNYGTHKQCDTGEDYQTFKGPPNFVLDVFPGNDWLDYDQRRSDYERAGVIEYVAVRDCDPLEWIWNRLVDGKFEEIEADHETMIASTALPGFWVPVPALKSRDWWTIMSKTTRGITRRGHHDFMGEIWNPPETEEE